jgi:hypothetical protein
MMRALGHLLLFGAFCWSGVMVYVLAQLPRAVFLDAGKLALTVGEVAMSWVAIGLPLSVLAIACYMASVSECVHDVSRWRPMPREDGEPVTRSADAA